MKKILNNLFTSEWKTIRTIWPYPEGYGVYRETLGKRTILDTGLSKEEAEKICKELNTKS